MTETAEEEREWGRESRNGTVYNTIMPGPHGEEWAGQSENQGAAWSGPVAETLREVARMVLTAETGAQPRRMSGG